MLYFTNLKSRNKKIASKTQEIFPIKNRNN